MALRLSQSISPVLRKLLPPRNAAAVRSYSTMLPGFSVVNNPYSCYSWLLHPSQNLYSAEHAVIPCWPKSKVIKPKNATRCIGSTRGWLVLIDPNDCSLYLSHPFPHKSIKLPSIHSLPSIRGDSVDPKVFPRVTTHFVLPSESGHLCRLPPEHVSRFILRQFALSAWNPGSYFDGSCVLMAISKHLETSHLVYCRFGENQKWEAVKVWGENNYSYYQVVYSCKNRLFYTLSHDGCITGWGLDVSDSIPKRSVSFFYKDLIENATKLEKSEKNLRDQCKSKHYIVADEASGDLLLVIKHYAEHVVEDGTILYDDPTGTFPYKTQRFDVYKVDIDGKKLEQLKSIGDDKVLFLGLNEPFSLPRSKHGGLKGDSIYFTDDFTEKIYTKESPYGGHDVGVFSLEDNSITESKSCSFFVGLDKKIEEPMFWVGPSTEMKAEENSKKAEENSKKAEENSKKAAAENSKKAAAENSKKAADENSMKADKNSGKNENSDSDSDSNTDSDSDKDSNTDSDSDEDSNTDSDSDEDSDTDSDSDSDEVSDTDSDEDTNTNEVTNK